MGALISRLNHAQFKSRWALWRLQYRFSSPRRQEKMYQRVIEKEVASDPEAVTPRLGVKPLLARSFREVGGYSGNVPQLFGINIAERPALRPSGVSSKARDIWRRLEKMEQEYQERTANISSGKQDQERYNQITNAYNDARLHAILDPCIQATQKFLDSHGYSGGPHLRPGYKKGHSITIHNTGSSPKEWYLISKTTYTLGFQDSNGNMRAYFVITLDPHMEERDSLYAYMCIIHQNLKDRGACNSSVFGLLTNTHNFNFYWIDSASKFYYCKTELGGWYHPFQEGQDPETIMAKLSTFGREYERRFHWDSRNQKWRTYTSKTEDVVTLCENILELGVKHCYGLIFAISGKGSDEVS
ncbi:hypothetical protein BJX76DRAFT_358824 [Aspergillus varians]